MIGTAYDEHRNTQIPVRRFCERCQASVSQGNYTRRMRDLGDVEIIAPSGIAHAGHKSGADRTACGLDATGNRWWHRL